MSTRTNRSRRTFRLESLEIRNAPSHFGGLARAAMAIHKVHAPAQVRHFSDTQAHDKVSSLDKGTGIERSPDNSVETNSNDLNGSDTSPNDRSSVDSSGQR
jgi:hypothetical protein